MNTDHKEFIWLDEHHEISIDEVIELSGLSLEEIHHLIDSGALIPSLRSEDVLHFSSHALVSIRTLARLKNDFELEPNALALTLVFLERIRVLEFQLSEKP